MTKESDPAGKELAALLTMKDDAGAFRVDDDVAALITTRLIVELAAAGAELPPGVVQRVGEVCLSIGVSDGDPRAALERAIAERAPGEVKTQLFTLLRSGDDGLLARAASTLGVESPKFDPQPPPAGSVPAGPLSRFQLVNKKP
jgi:hypothetical protein